MTNRHSFPRENGKHKFFQKDDMYYIKIKSCTPSFPLVCPYCGKRDSSRSITLNKMVICEENEKPKSQTIMVPTCDDCWFKGGFYSVLSLFTTIAFFFLLTAKLWWEPVQNLSTIDFLTYLGVSTILTAAFNRLRTEHLNQCHIVNHNEVGLLIRTRNRSFANSLALLNKSIVEEKRR